MYIFIVFWLMLCWKFCNREKVMHLIVAIIPIFVMIAFRAETVGTDTAGYLYTFSIIDRNESLRQLLSNWDTEKGYLVLCYILKYCGFGNQSLLIAEAFIFCGSIVYFCKHNANDRLFMLMATVLTLSEFALSGIRQTIALSVFLIAYRFAREHKWKVYIILAILALSFHTSALLVFPFAILINRQFNGNTIIIYIAILLLSFASMSTIFSTVTSLLKGYEEYQLMSLDGGYVSFVTSVLFCLVILSCYKKEKTNILFQQTSHYAILNMVMSAIRFVNVMIMRVLLYLSVFPYLMVDSLKETTNANRYKFVAAFYAAAYFIYRLGSLNNYIFYWQ